MLLSLLTLWPGFGLSLVLLIKCLLRSLVPGLPASRLLLFLPVRPLFFLLVRTLSGPVRGLVCRLARFAGISGIYSLLIKDLVDKILLFEELCPLNFELLGYFPQFGNQHLAQFKNIMHVFKMCREIK